MDLFCTVSERDDLSPSRSAQSHVKRLFVHHRKPYGPGMRRILRWLTTGWPRAVAWREWDDAAAALSSFARPPYDLIWYSACGTWLGLGEPQRVPAVVDFNDLEDEKLRTMRRLFRAQRDEAGIRRPLLPRLRRTFGALLDAIDERRWTRAQRSAADGTAAVVVCSELDRKRLGHPAAVVVPNAYELAEASPARVAPADPAFTMVGLLTYPPNADAAVYFARAILPLIRTTLPQARFKLVGRHDDAARAWSALPGVDVLGPVAELDAVFTSTTAVVVPLRAGGGTRIKILEAFARRVPVVSTALGCEGLDAGDGQELLVADGPDEFAAACVRLFQDEGLATALADKGHALWSSRYRAADVREQVRSLALEVVQRP